MRWTGIIVGLFVFVSSWPTSRGGVSTPGYVRGDVYRNVERFACRATCCDSVRRANISLGIHLYHVACDPRSVDGVEPRPHGSTSGRRGFAIVSHPDRGRERVLPHRRVAGSES
jgi:hypothetical protein